MIDDCCNTVSLSDFGYGAPADEPAAQPGVYQFSYPYTDADHPDESVYGNSGMMYIPCEKGSLNGSILRSTASALF